MYQAEACFLHHQETGELVIPDGIEATITSTKASSDKNCKRRLTWINFPDGSSLSYQIGHLLGRPTIHCHVASEEESQEFRALMQQ